MMTNPNPSPTPTSLVPPNLDDDADLQALLDLLAEDNTAEVLADLVASFDRGDELVAQLARDMAEADAALSGGTS